MKCPSVHFKFSSKVVRSFVRLSLMLPLTEQVLFKDLSWYRCADVFNANTEGERIQSMRLQGEGEGERERTKGKKHI